MKTIIFIRTTLTTPEGGPMPGGRPRKAVHPNQLAAEAAEFQKKKRHSHHKKIVPPKDEDDAFVDPPPKQKTMRELGENAFNLIRAAEGEREKLMETQRAARLARDAKAAADA